MDDRKDFIKSKNGMITVEAVLCLVPFILVILGIISFTNIFMVHNKIQHAIYETANELSAYTYFYQAFGIRDADKKLQGDIEENTKELIKFLSSIEEARVVLNEDKIDMDSVEKAVDDVMESGEELVSDPKGVLRALIFEGIGKGEEFLKKLLLEAVAKPLTQKYLDATFLSTGGQTADAYLEAYGVKGGMNGLDFGESVLFTDDSLEVIDIVVEYDLEIYFFKLFLKDPTIHVVQRAVVPAWLDGDGGRYEPKFK